MGVIDKVSVGGTTYDVQDSAARAWTGAMPKLNNILWDVQNVTGKHTDTTRNRVVEIDRNMVKYTRTGSSTAGRAYVLTGSTFRSFSPNSSYRVTTSMTEEADFIPLPVSIADVNASQVYLWVYSPDNASCTTYDSTNPGYTQNRLLFATRDAEGNVWLDASGDGVTISQSHNGVYTVRLDTEFSSLWSHMISDGTLAVYYICRINNSGLNGTMYWGIGIDDGIAGNTVTKTGSAPTITAVSGTRYVCSASYVTSLSFTPSATGICSVRFVSGTTATVLTLPQTVVMPEWWTGVEASRTYEISIEDGIYGAVTSWA